MGGRWMGDRGPHSPPFEARHAAAEIPLLASPGFTSLRARRERGQRQDQGRSQRETVSAHRLRPLPSPDPQQRHRHSTSLHFLPFYKCTVFCIRVLFRILSSLLAANINEEIATLRCFYHQ